MQACKSCQQMAFSLLKMLPFEWDFCILQLQQMSVGQWLNNKWWNPLHTSYTKQTSSIKFITCKLSLYSQWDQATHIRKKHLTWCLVINIQQLIYMILFLKAFHRPAFQVVGQKNFGSQKKQRPLKAKANKN